MRILCVLVVLFAGASGIARAETPTPTPSPTPFTREWSKVVVP